MSTEAIPTREAESTGGKATPGWLVLAIDSLRLALAQRDVRQIELVADLKPVTDGETCEVGWLLQKDDGHWPVYCLDGTLHLRRAAPQTRRACVFVEADGNTIGIVCDRVWSLAMDAELAIEPLPGCMGGVRSPISGLARFREGIAVVVKSADLNDYLSFLQKRENGARE